MAFSREDLDKLVGSPWRLINVSDFLAIGLMSLLFMLMLQVLGLGWHRMQLLRATGSAASPSQLARTGTGFPSGSTIDPNATIGVNN